MGVSPSLLVYRCLSQTRYPRVYVYTFNGNVMASGVRGLTRFVDLMIQVAKPTVDRVVIRLTSPGGAVMHYGLAASQLARLREHNIHLTACIDLVAASGGYMMACVANHIIAAPFSIVGSIGVIAAFPNFHRIMKKHELDYLEFTAGKYKRTVTPFTEVTEAGRAKFLEQLMKVYEQFKAHIVRYRPKLAPRINDLATGDYWLSTDALELGLVDDIMACDEYLHRQTNGADVVLVKKNKGNVGSFLKELCGQKKKKSPLDDDDDDEEDVDAMATSQALGDLNPFGLGPSNPLSRPLGGRSNSNSIAAQLGRAVAPMIKEAVSAAAMEVMSQSLTGSHPSGLGGGLLGAQVSTVPLNSGFDLLNATLPPTSSSPSSSSDTNPTPSIHSSQTSAT